MNTPIASTAPLRTITPSATSLRAPMKQSSSIMTGSACSGSSTPPMPTPPELCTRLPIWAQEPTVDHGGFIDIGAKIDEVRHQHDVAGDEGRTAHDRARHRAEAGVAETVLAP